MWMLHWNGENNWEVTQFVILIQSIKNWTETTQFFFHKLRRKIVFIFLAFLIFSQHIFIKPEMFFCVRFFNSTFLRHLRLNPLLRCPHSQTYFGGMILADRCDRNSRNLSSQSVQLYNIRHHLELSQVFRNYLR